MYTLATHSDQKNGNIYTLMTGQWSMVCPFKTSQAIMVPEPVNKLQVAGKREMNMVFKGYIDQPCNSKCPLFSMRQDDKENIIQVTLCCGIGRTILLETQAGLKKV